MGVLKGVLVIGGAADRAEVRCKGDIGKVLDGHLASRRHEIETCYDGEAEGAHAAAGAVGITNQAMAYTSTPQTSAPGKIARTTAARRTIVESRPRNSATPPHTPPILRSVVERSSGRPL